MYHAHTHTHTHTRIHTVSCSKDPAKFFAERLYKSMKGLGTDEDTLTRVIVSRCEIDLEHVKEAFQKAYGKTLDSFIKVISNMGLTV